MTKNYRIVRDNDLPKNWWRVIYDKDNQELVSKKGKLAYPIVDGIPVMLEDEARKIK